MVKPIYYIILVLLNIPIIGYSQKTDTTFIGVNSVEKMPVFADSLDLFIQNSIIYPVSASIDSIEGTVIVGYKVGTDGHTTNHKILKGVREDIDEEAIRVARLLVYDKPAMDRGNPVEVNIFIPIVFKLRNGNIPKGL